MKQRLLTPLYRLYERRLLAGLDRSALPRHIGIILDGHRRYARAERMPDYTTSYRAGMAKFESVMLWARDLGIDITGWVLSTENLERPAEEIEPYFDVLIELFERLPELPTRLVEAAKRASEQCTEGTNTVTIAMGYGGRQEIVDACRELVEDLVAQGVPADQLAQRIDKESISAHLYTADLPDPDLVIRTSGESRLSGFLLWQSAYAEYAFVDVFWPAFRRVDFLRALRDFARRERRFGQ